MYSIDSFNILYNGEIIYSIERPFDKMENVPIKEIVPVLKQRNNHALVHYWRKKGKKGLIYECMGYPYVYLFSHGKLVKQFSANTYYCNPGVDFIRDYFILNEYSHHKHGGYLNLYNLEGNLIRSINYRWQFVRGIHIINDDYFILYRWAVEYKPVYMTTLYHFDTMMKYPFRDTFEAAVYDFKGIYIGVDIEKETNKNEFKVITLEEAQRLHENYKER